MLLRVLRAPRYALLATLSAAALGAGYPALQVINQLNNYDFWWAILLGSPASFVLYFVFIGLFGASVALGVHNVLHRTCEVRRGASGTAGAAVLGLFPALCSGCGSLATLLLPLSGAVFLQLYSTPLMAGAIGLMALSIHWNGGFKP